MYIYLSELHNYIHVHNADKRREPTPLILLDVVNLVTSLYLKDKFGNVVFVVARANLLM